MNNDLQILLQEFEDQLIGLYNQGKYLTLVEQAKSLTEEYSMTHTIWNILGATTGQSEMMNKSIEAYKKYISLNPKMIMSTKVTSNIMISGVETQTKIANWRQSIFYNILTNPLNSTYEIFHKDTNGFQYRAFNLISELVSKLKIEIFNMNWKN